MLKTVPHYFDEEEWKRRPKSIKIFKVTRTNNADMLTSFRGPIKVS